MGRKLCMYSYHPAQDKPAVLTFVAPSKDKARAMARRHLAIPRLPKGYKIVQLCCVAKK